MATVLAPGWIWNYPIKTASVRHLVERPATHYKPDFAWPERMLCLEVDGETHRSRAAQDRKKEKILASLGWSVLRITNQEVKKMFGISR